MSRATVVAERRQEGITNSSGRGQQRDKPYREALRLELAAAGSDLKRLRRIAQAHLELAEKGDMGAIKELADRLDGKPAQENNITVTRVKANELSDNELADIASGSGEGVDQPPLDPSLLN